MSDLRVISEASLPNSLSSLEGEQTLSGVYKLQVTTLLFDTTKFEDCIEKWKHSIIRMLTSLCIFCALYLKEHRLLIHGLVFSLRWQLVALISLLQLAL